MVRVLKFQRVAQKLLERSEHSAGLGSAGVLLRGVIISISLFGLGYQIFYKQTFLPLLGKFNFSRCLVVLYEPEFF